MDHLAIAVRRSADGFEARAAREPMSRRPPGLQQRIARAPVLGLSFIPTGTKAPPEAQPRDRPDRADVERRFREGVDRFLDLERRLLPARAADLFVKHLRLGDLTLGEWMRFHVRHALHHAKQIRERLEVPRAVV